MPNSRYPMSRCVSLGRYALALLAVLALAPLSAAKNERAPGPGEAVNLVVYPALSSDGSFVVFSWRDDLWRYTFESAALKRLTMHPARDVRPFLSPDDKRVAFVSNREGSDQIWVMPVERGCPQTGHATHGSRSTVWLVSGWGACLLSQSARSPLASWQPDLQDFNRG